MALQTASKNGTAARKRYCIRWNLFRNMLNNYVLYIRISEVISLILEISSHTLYIIHKNMIMILEILEEKIHIFQIT